MLSQVNDWMENLLYDDADDLYRFKGVLAIEDWPDRFIFQVDLVPCLSAAHSSQFSVLLASSLSFFTLQTCAPGQQRHHRHSRLFALDQSWIGQGAD